MYLIHKYRAAPVSSPDYPCSPNLSAVACLAFTSRTKVPFKLRTILIALAISAIGLTAAKLAASPPQNQPSNAASSRQTGWPAYGGGPLNDHYSALTQINRSNVKLLQLAWTFDTGEKGGLQASPIIVGETVYGITPSAKSFCPQCRHRKTPVGIRFRHQGNSTRPRPFLLDRWP